MRDINRIIVHCSATPEDMDIGVEEIRKWHTDKGWSDVGYHYVIRRDGLIEDGRDLWRPGAHTKGYNRKSVGICMVGGIDADDKSKAEANFTLAQYNSLKTLVHYVQSIYSSATLHGHREFANKACPCFDVKALLGAS